jgi:hypothetical protein
MRDPFDKDGARQLLDDRQLEYLAGWLRRNADTLGLTEWEVRASPFEWTEGNAATHVVDKLDTLTVALSSDFLEHESSDEQRQTLAHELVHPYFYRVSRAAERLIAGELGTRTEALFEEALEIFEEISVDRLGRAIAKWLEPFDMPRAAA